MPEHYCASSPPQARLGLCRSCCNASEPRRVIVAKTQFARMANRRGDVEVYMCAWCLLGVLVLVSWGAGFGWGYRVCLLCITLSSLSVLYLFVLVN